ncbi:Clp protease N-terminal domain-containing protein [Streptomyces sp. NPDC018610]|uniref:Clp protease N-terminal domain-containing protein n=1 Tax=Streptomyces sp. NPDC018610 TaxID=3365049 RepID=UPI0037A9AB34
MRDRIPGQPAHAQDDRRADGDAGLGAELTAVVAAARRRAVRDGDRQTDTAHLLHTLLESDPRVRAAFGEGPRIARLFGYLVQRSIGYGLRWQSSVEDSGALPVHVPTGAAAEAAPDGADGCSPLASAALRHARERAARRGDGPARGLDLLAGVLADPDARAVEVLARAGVDARELAVRLDNDAKGRPEEYAGDHRDAR